DVRIPRRHERCVRARCLAILAAYDEHEGRPRTVGDPRDGWFWDDSGPLPARSCSPAWGLHGACCSEAVRAQDEGTMNDRPDPPRVFANRIIRQMIDHMLSEDMIAEPDDFIAM